MHKITVKFHGMTTMPTARELQAGGMGGGCVGCVCANWGFIGRRSLTQKCQLLPWAGSSSPWLCRVERKSSCTAFLLGWVGTAFGGGGGLCSEAETAHKAAVGPVQPGEPGDLTASLQCGPVQPFQQAVDAGGVPVSAKHKMGCSSWGSRTEEAYSSSGHWQSIQSRCNDKRRADPLSLLGASP